MNAENRIVIDPAICHGKPVIRGTRMPVSLVVGSLAGGMSFEQLRQEYDLPWKTSAPRSNTSAIWPNSNPFICSPRKPCAFVDANMPRSTLALLAGLGHTGVHAATSALGMRPTPRLPPALVTPARPSSPATWILPTSAIIHRTNSKASSSCGCPTMPWRKPSSTC